METLVQRQDIRSTAKWFTSYHVLLISHPCWHVCRTKIDQAFVCWSLLFQYIHGPFTRFSCCKIPLHLHGLQKSTSCNGQSQQDFASLHMGIALAALHGRNAWESAGPNGPTLSKSRVSGCSMPSCLMRLSDVALGGCVSPCFAE